MQIEMAQLTQGVQEKLCLFLFSQFTATRGEEQLSKDTIVRPISERPIKANGRRGGRTIPGKKYIFSRAPCSL